MGAAPGSGWEEGEFEFKLVFEEDPPLRQSHSISIPSPPPSANQRAGMHSPPPRRAPVREFSGTYESLPARSVQVSESRVVECPSIQITTISPEDDPASNISSYWDMGGGGGGWDRDRLYLPLLDPFSYRDRCPGSLSPSPASSPSSRGWLSPASSCDSLLVEEEELNEAAINFGLSPSSRPTSPGGKKRRNSPLASPCTSRRGSYSDDLQGCNLEGGDSISLSQAPPSSCELSIPQKTRKTSLEQLSPREVDQEQAPGHGSPCLLTETQQTRREPPSVGMDYLSVPPALAWGRTRASAHSPLFSSALPPLDWPLPSQFDQYELRIDVQPRPHHRAHYETEGSRGAVKATPSGHPIVKLCGYSERKPLSLQVFVGTADDRSIRPHPFYQIHVTGKMVGTASHESVQAGTKILDIPLNPENNMTAIDCAGILKLRNSDIELRKGETDVGRKNTRVRLVFRTHLPLAPPVAPPGRVLALQVASQPIECAQRSAQELPVIESVSLTSCSVEGGEELLLSGNNYLPISRVLFMERGTGKLQWEEEAHVDRDNSNEGLLCVRVPAYSDLSVNRPVSVSLYVSNGKRKRSSTHCFKYLPMFKEEDPLLSRPSALPLQGGSVCPVGDQTRMDRGFHMRGDPMGDDRGLGFHLPPYPSTYSPPAHRVTMTTTARNQTLCWRIPAGPGRLSLNVTPASRTWSWASPSSFLPCTPAARSLPPPPLHHGWTHLTCPPHLLPPTPPPSARFQPAVPSPPPLCLPSRPPRTPSTPRILRRCVHPRHPTSARIRTSAQRTTPNTTAGTPREGCWGQDMGERGMPRSRSFLWSSPALHLCTTSRLRNQSSSVRTSSPTSQAHRWTTGLT
uniref:Nuclear factor of activated T cells 4 n=1 Tax=Labrus bergylta TaxID=56723 RepID=A0A3Q3LAM3_9LABR